MIFSCSLYPQGRVATVPWVWNFSQPLIRARGFTEDCMPATPLEQHISPRVQLHHFETIITKQNSISTYCGARPQSCLSQSLKAHFHWHFATSTSWRVSCNSQHNTLHCSPKISRNCLLVLPGPTATLSLISTCVCSSADLERDPLVLLLRTLYIRLSCSSSDPSSFHLVCLLQKPPHPL